MCMRASLENFGISTFLNCYFFRYFVGTSDALSVQSTCLSAYMYRQISQCTDKFPNVPTKVRCFVGTSDALSVQSTCLSAYMYRQISQCTDKFPNVPTQFPNVPTKVRKGIIGGQLPPPPPPLWLR